MAPAVGGKYLFVMYLIHVAYGIQLHRAHWVTFSARFENSRVGNAPFLKKDVLHYFTMDVRFFRNYITFRDIVKRCPVPEFIDPRFRENKPKTLVFT